jgi:hypothetical protein
MIKESFVTLAARHCAWNSLDTRSHSAALGALQTGLTATPGYIKSRHHPSIINPYIKQLNRRIKPFGPSQLMDGIPKD